MWQDGTGQLPTEPGEPLSLSLSPSPQPAPAPTSRPTRAPLPARPAAGGTAAGRTRSSSKRRSRLALPMAAAQHSPHTLPPARLPSKWRPPPPPSGPAPPRAAADVALPGRSGEVTRAAHTSPRRPPRVRGPAPPARPPGFLAPAGEGAGAAVGAAGLGAHARRSARVARVWQGAGEGKWRPCCAPSAPRGESRRTRFLLVAQVNAPCGGARIKPAVLKR